LSSDEKVLYIFYGKWLPTYKRILNISFEGVLLKPIEIIDQEKALYGLMERYNFTLNVLPSYLIVQGEMSKFLQGLISEEELKILLDK